MSTGKAVEKLIPRDILIQNRSAERFLPSNSFEIVSPKLYEQSHSHSLYAMAKRAKVYGFKRGCAVKDSDVTASHVLFMNLWGVSSE